VHNFAMGTTKKVVKEKAHKFATVYIVRVLVML